MLRHAPVPVLVLRGPLPRHLLRVLLTTDLSEFSGRIHESGLDVVETLFGDEKPEIRSLHVVWHGGDLPYPVQHELPDEGGSLTSFLGQRRIRTRSVQPTIRYGDPAKEIAAEVSDWGADLLVMGTHGRKGAVRWFLGSVAELTIRSAVSSVLVIPALAEEQRMLQTAPAATAPDG